MSFVTPGFLLVVLTSTPVTMLAIKRHRNNTPRTPMEWSSPLSLVPSSVIQAKNTVECAGQIYDANEIPRSQRAKLKSRPLPGMTQEAVSHDIHGRVVVEAVLCRTGTVTDLRIIEGLPYGLTEAAVHAVSTIKFAPAEMNWHSVSQRQRFEFGFNERFRQITSTDTAGRLVETIEVVGNRRLSDAEVVKHIRSKPGEPYDEQQVKNDLQSIFSTGYFNKLTTRVITEDGVRGGVVVVFEVEELPLIDDVNFQGLPSTQVSDVLDALRRQQIDLRKGAVYDTAKVKIAAELIRRMLEASGQENTKVEVLSRKVTATHVALTFVISRE